MITRISEAAVRPGRLEEFRQAVLAEIRGYPDRFDGLIDDFVAVSDSPPTLLYVSRWADEAAVERFAGPGWRDTPVQFAGEDEFLLEPLRVRHFSFVPPR